MSKLKQSTTKLSTGVVLTSMALGLNALAQTSDPALNALIKKGILTEAEAKQALADTEAQKKITPGVTETNRSLFVLASGPEFKMKLGGFLQGNAEFGDIGAFEGNLKGGNDRFRLRRARLNVSGEFLEHFDYKLEGEFENGDGLASDRTGFSGTDLFVNWNRIPEANVKFGQYKAPFGLEQLSSDTSLYMAERSLPTGSLTPERQLGVQVWGKPLSTLASDYKDLLEYSFGVFNGNGRNTTINDNDQFMYAGRVTTTPFTGTLFDQPVKWKLGGDGLYSRYAKGTRVSPTGNLLFGSDGSLSKFEAPGDARAWGWGVDQTLTVGPVDLIAEYLEQKISPAGNNAFNRFVANGYYVQASYFFPGKKLQAVSRWESFNPGQAKDDDIRSIAGGLNWYIKGDNIKLMFDYWHTWSDFREDRAGLGKDQFDMGLVRLQLMF